MATLCFGEFELDTERQRLLRRGRVVAVQEQPLRLLLLLLARPGELVTREQVCRDFWPDDVSGILDDNLNTLVRKLRQALGDSARSSRFIETIPRQGYRFVAPVTTGEDASESTGTVTPDKPAPVNTPLSPNHRRSLAVIAGSLLMAFAFFIYQLVPFPESGKNAPRHFESVAVLPFVNASEDYQRDYFSDGLADDILNRLSGFPGLHVVSRTSSFSLQQSGLDARGIGKLLATDALVEGSVRRDGEQLRINVRLVDTSNGYQLWSRSYQRELTDIFSVQEDIALQVASALAGKLQSGRDLGPRAAGISSAAYDNYLKGRFYWHRRSERDLKAAVEYFEQAIALAPEYAPAWAGLADALAVLGFYDYLPPAEAFTRARGAARRTLQLDPANASAEANLGYVALYHDWDLAEAEARFLQAIAFKPDSSKAHQWYANLLVAAGRFDEAEREMRKATELDPLSLIANAALGWVLYHAGAHQAALEQLALVEELNPEFELVYLWRGWTQEAMGDYPGAIASLRENVARSGGSAIGVASLARVLALSGNREEAVTLLKGLNTPDAYLPSYEMAKAYLALAGPEAAGTWLQRAYDQRSHSMVFLNVDPQLAAIRETSDYQKLVAQVLPHR
ncbi:tetratricopeptide repeat protein [Microbulbifer sp. CAU 1566]|uniref:tetratricopeptide repeat protein n=1 Tax=Microbulbifer sp. CAU 1566 TaxID=2933269 RepID=UPI002004D819|nr:tetratricopeptide repeat protein [Microbulbifer sp. CAU 1566]MCK7596633.1 tetratricopeptide repeat protein [Microbulbifer sp. CAU 1566]